MLTFGKDCFVRRGDYGIDGILSTVKLLIRLLS
jgi:hypothetical protein